MPSYRDFRPTRRFQPTVALSPDGRLVAYADDRGGQFNLVVQPVSGGPSRQLTRYTDRTVRRIAWHPAGDSLVFLADSKGDERTQVYRVGVDGGEPVALTDAAGVEYALALGGPFSSDGRRLAYAGNDRMPADQDVLIRDLATGEVRRVYAGGGQVYPGHWSPDGTRLTVAEWVDTSSDHVVYLVPTDDGAATRLSPAGVTAVYHLGPWLPDGSGFLVRTDAGRDVIGLAVMEAATGALSWLDTPEWEVADAALSADGRTAVWVVNVDGAAQLRARDVTTGTDLAAPDLPAGVTNQLAVTPDGGLAATLLTTPTSPPNVVTVDLASGQLCRLTDAAPAGADPATFVEPTLIRYPSRDGTQIPAYLYRPAGIDQQPCPVVLYLHGGPHSQERPFYVALYHHLLANGIAVFAPNVRGSSGYGGAYRTRVDRDWGGIDVDDWSDAVRHLRSQGWADPTRIAVAGGSYGGFGVLSCLSRLPDVGWAAGVDYFGISNLVTLVRSSPPTWRSKVAIMIGDADRDAEFLLSRSPVTHADRITAPLFVIQGANDRRVPRQESDQIVQRLRDRGVDVRYDVYADEGHGFTQAANEVKASSDAADFLVSHLTT